MRPRRVCRKAVLVISASLLIFSLGGKIEVASKALSQTTCGEWNLTLNGGREASQDGKITIKLIHPVDSRCEGVYTLNNNTGVASIGGYTLELVLDSQNADVRGLETTLLTPYRPIDIKAEPQDKNKAALVKIQGQMTKEAYLFDFAYLTGKSIINHVIPSSLCIIPDESLAMVAIRLMDITSHAAAEFGEGNFRAASEEFSGIFDALLEAMIESFKEAGENCAVDALKLKLGKVGAQKLQIFLDVAKWLVPWYRDYFKGEWSHLILSYFAAGKIDLTPEPTPTTVTHLPRDPSDQSEVSVIERAVDMPLHQEAYLKAFNSSEDDGFGGEVAISGNTVLVGSSGEDSGGTGIDPELYYPNSSNSGAAYVFVYEGSTWVQQAFLKASNADSEDDFGRSVAIDENTIVVGASGESSNATGINGNQLDNSLEGVGAAYVFVRDGTTWTQQAYLKASNAERMDCFGTTVAISGNTIVVGAIGEDSSATGVNGNQSDNSKPFSGAAYVFERTGDAWVQTAYLKASNTDSKDNFCNVAISEDTIVIGATREDSRAKSINGNQNEEGFDTGAAYVFVRDGSTWKQQAYLKASNASNMNYFGEVAISGDTIVVGAHFEDSHATGVNGEQNSLGSMESGAAYIFVRSGNNWVQQAYLKPSNTDKGDYFGSAVAISGNVVIIGAGGEDSSAIGINGSQQDNNSESSGAAYIFVRTDDTWSQVAYVKSSNSEAGDNLRSVAISDGTIIIGAAGEDSKAKGINGDQTDNSATDSGAVYVFFGQL